MSAQQKKDVLETLTTCSIVLRQVSSYSAHCEIYASIAKSDIKAMLHQE